MSPLAAAFPPGLAVPGVPVALPTPRAGWSAWEYFTEQPSGTAWTNSGVNAGLADGGAIGTGTWNYDSASITAGGLLPSSLLHCTTSTSFNRTIPLGTLALGVNPTAGVPVERIFYIATFQFDTLPTNVQPFLSLRGNGVNLAQMRLVPGTAVLRKTNNTATAGSDGTTAIAALTPYSVCWMVDSVAGKIQWRLYDRYGALLETSDIATYSQGPPDHANVGLIGAPGNAVDVHFARLGFSTVDWLLPAGGGTAAPVDALPGLADALTRSQIQIRTAADALPGLAEAITRGGQLESRVLADTALVGETLARSQGTQVRTAADSVPVADAVTRSQLQARALSDFTGQGSTPTIRGHCYKTRADATSITLVSTDWSTAPSAGDAIVIIVTAVDPNSAGEAGAFSTPTGGVSTAWQITELGDGGNNHRLAVIRAVATGAYQTITVQTSTASSHVTYIVEAYAVQAPGSYEVVPSVVTGSSPSAPSVGAGADLAFYAAFAGTAGNAVGWAATGGATVLDKATANATHPCTLVVSTETVATAGARSFTGPVGWDFAASVAVMPGQTGGVTDAATRAQGLQSRASSDSVPVADAVTRVQADSRATADSIPLSEALTRGAQSQPRTLADTALVGDAVTRSQGTQVRAAADSVPLADALTRSQTQSRALADSVPLADVVTRAQGTQARTAADSVPLAAAATRSQTQSRALADSIPVADVVTRAQAAQARALADSIPLAAALARSQQQSRALADSVPVAGVLTRSQAQSRGPADTVPLADAAAVSNLIVSRHTVDVLPLADVATFAPAKKGTPKLRARLPQF